MTVVAQKAETRGERAGPRFVAAVAAATILPWMAVLILHGLEVRPTAGAFAVLVFLLGPVHVGTSAAFYLDPQLRSLVASNRSRYYVAAGGVVLAGLVLSLGPDWIGPWVVVPGVGMWQLHHFTRQNLGMLAFTYRASGLGGPTPRERHLLDLTTVAGMLGLLPLLAPFEVDTRPVGLVVLAVAAVGLLRGTAGVRLWALTAAVLFYSPLFLINDLVVAAYAYGLAHGAQYLLMMAHLPVGRDSDGRRRMLLALAGAFLVVSVPYYLGDRAVMLAGVTAAHFIVDAGIWKMRTPEQRAYMRRRFAFL